jgi:hypothetical protein
MSAEKNKPEGPTRSIHALVALYELEPTVRDLYVEGESDKRLLEWFLQERGIEKAEVYPASLIEVSASLLAKHGLDNGSNRAKIIALSAELAESVPKPSQVRCIVDRDFEEYIPIGINNSILLLTDYNSMELYLFNRKTVNKFIKIVLGGLRLGSEDLLESAGKVLEAIYVFRLANQKLAWNMQWIPFTRYVDVGDSLSFRSEAFVSAYLQKNNRWSERDLFQGAVAKLKVQLCDDPRLRIRGHDFMVGCTP